MEKLLSVVNAIKSKDLKESNGKINQTVRNEIKAELLSALALDLETLGALRTKDGIAIPVESETSRNLVTITLDPVIKNLDYDPDLASEEYAELMKEREERAAEMARKKAERNKK